MSAAVPDPAARALRARNLRTLGVLAALFLAPLLVAFFTYYGTGWRPAGHVNHGRLITPVRPLSALQLPPRVSLDGQATVAAGARAAEPAPAPFHGKWSLVYVGAGGCNDACRAALYLMRQTRLALNNDMTRVERVFVVTSDCCAGEFLAREHAGLVLLDGSGPGAAPLVRAFPGADRAHTLYVVDPLGNLMMSYDARQDPHGLLEDLQKLLRLSHIG